MDFPGQTSDQGFRLTPTDVIYRSQFDSDGDQWQEGRFQEWGETSLSPAAAVLSYGLGVFEGLKAERSPEGKILVFRLDDHARRFESSAATLLMPPFPAVRFGEVVQELILRNRLWIPSCGAGSLYVRPLLYSDEPRLGLGPANRFATTIFASPVGKFFSSLDTDSLRLRVIDRSRTAPGLGATKCIANYAAVLGAIDSARSDEFDDVIFVDPGRPGYVTETSGANLFVRLGSGELVTPPLEDHLFPGVTRDSVLRIASEELGLKIEERPLAIVEILGEATEIFCTGTAWSVAPVGEIEHRGASKTFLSHGTQTAILRVLREIQTGVRDDAFGWMRQV